ncbi:predicted protein [Nematostella vectensis]|uniref:Calx-beta domain-containing protein n=1 Tax=Nematostella vectensis TaxID=45351 RepID=A7SVJ2_NEMVE|nr:predicted protein [Nematostella vectensis]|eukprot:XP_001624375.1 predicted protein [Nematostella vectensis]
MPPWCRKWVFFGVILALSVTPANAQTYIGFDLSDVPVPESAGTATLGLTRSGDVSGESLVTAGTATLGLTRSGDVSGESLVTITDDGTVENTESFFVQLTTTDGSINITQPNITVSITDNDKATFSVAPASVTEDTGFLTLNVTKSGITDMDLFVRLDTQDETAVSPDDFVAIVNDTLKFPKDVASVLVNVSIVVEDIVEKDETFKAHLSTNNPTQVIVSSPRTITIENDDAVKHQLMCNIGTKKKFPSFAKLNSRSKNRTN